MAMDLGIPLWVIDRAEALLAGHRGRLGAGNEVVLLAVAAEEVASLLPPTRRTLDAYELFSGYSGITRAMRKRGLKCRCFDRA